MFSYRSSSKAIFQVLSLFYQSSGLDIILIKSLVCKKVFTIEWGSNKIKQYHENPLQSIVVAYTMLSLMPENVL